MCEIPELGREGNQTIERHMASGSQTLVILFSVQK